MVVIIINSVKNEQITRHRSSTHYNFLILHLLLLLLHHILPPSHMHRHVDCYSVWSALCAYYSECNADWFIDQCLRAQTHEINECFSTNKMQFTINRTMLGGPTQMCQNSFSRCRQASRQAIKLFCVFYIYEKFRLIYLCMYDGKKSLKVQRYHIRIRVRIKNSTTWWHIPHILVLLYNQIKIYDFWFWEQIKIPMQNISVIFTMSSILIIIGVIVQY